MSLPNRSAAQYEPTPGVPAAAGVPFTPIQMDLQREIATKSTIHLKRKAVAVGIDGNAEFQRKTRCVELEQTIRMGNSQIS